MASNDPVTSSASIAALKLVGIPEGEVNAVQIMEIIREQMDEVVHDLLCDLEQHDCSHCGHMYGKINAVPCDNPDHQHTHALLKSFGGSGKRRRQVRRKS